MKESKIINDEEFAATIIQSIFESATKKDFCNLFELLERQSLQQIVDWHTQKFPNHLQISIPHVIAYFVDAEESEDPLSLKGQPWENVKKGIQKAVRDYLK